MIVDLDRAVRRLGVRTASGVIRHRSASTAMHLTYVLLGDPGAGKSTAFEREQSVNPPL